MSTWPFHRRNEQDVDRDYPVVEFDMVEDMKSTLAERLRQAPPLERPVHEFAPQPAEYSLDRVQSFLSRHIHELQEMRAQLAAEAATAEAHLAEIERRRTVTEVAHDALAETLAKLTDRIAALDTPPVEQIEAQQTATEREETEAA